MALGMPVEVAGVFINSLAFLGALVLVYFWVEERYNTDAAKWTIAVLAWCPFSLFLHCHVYRGIVSAADNLCFAII